MVPALIVENAIGLAFVDVIVPLVEILPVDASIESGPTVRPFCTVKFVFAIVPYLPAGYYTGIYCWNTVAVAVLLQVFASRLTLPALNVVLNVASEFDPVLTTPYT
jgi:hypothetical protein